MGDKYPIEYGEKPIANLRSSTQYAIRTIAMINDFYLHKMFTRVNRLRGTQGITKETDELIKKFEKYNRGKGHSEQSVYRFSSEINGFLRYLHNNEVKISEIAEKDVIDFLGTYIDCSRDTIKRMLAVMRRFLAFLNESGQHESNLSDCVPSTVNIQNDKIPSVWAKDDVKNLLSSVDRGSALGKRDYAILMLVVMCGLRISEALNLRFCDVDLECGILTVLDTKFRKDRLIPVNTALLERLRNYAAQVLTFAEPQSPFFPTQDGRFYAPGSIYHAFRDILWEAGISHGGRGKGPRIYDFRHTFAVRCLKKWVLAGDDLSVALPYLSAYMGHDGIRHTQIYLRLTADLYPDIVRKMESRFDVLPEFGGAYEAY